MPLLAGASLHSLAGHRVAVAISGGADSVALALWLHDRSPGQVALAGLIHVNHHLRGPESDRDEAFCRALAARLHLPIDVVAGPVANRAGRSPESAARAVRYRAFVDAAARLGATRVVTAHTADDQAETVMMRLLRGAGSRGLSGIRAERGLYSRPFLSCRRRAVRDWLESRNEPWCEDATNADRSLMRNRVRHELLPVIEAMAPGGVDALARAATMAADDEAVLQAAATESAADIVLEAGADSTELDRTRLGALPPAIARRVIRLALDRLAPAGSWNTAHLEAVRRLGSRQAGGGSLDLPGVRVERVSNVLRVSVDPDRPAPPFAYAIDLGADVVVPEAGVRVTAADGPVRESDADDEAYSLLVPREAFPVTVRNRRPGDRVALSGGTRKVQDLMVDAKVPRSKRSRLPLVVTASGQVMWVMGRQAPTAESGAGGMVVLKLRKLERT